MVSKYRNTLTWLVLIIGLAGSSVFTPESLAAKLVDEDVCILENMGNTRSQVARFHISQACNFLSLHEASLILNREQRAFHECVLKYLPGVEADLNATDLTRSCQQLAWNRKGGMRRSW